MVRHEQSTLCLEQLDFYAVSRYEDVERTYKDHPTFISGRGFDINQLPGESDYIHV